MRESTYLFRPGLDYHLFDKVRTLDYSEDYYRRWHRDDDEDDFDYALDAAWASYDRIRYVNPLVIHDLAVIRAPQTVTHGRYFLEFYLTRAGRRALETLERGLVYSTYHDAPDLEETVRWWRGMIAPRNLGRERPQRTLKLSDIQNAMAIDHPEVRDAVLAEMNAFIMLCKLDENSGRQGDMWVLADSCEAS